MKVLSETFLQFMEPALKAFESPAPMTEGFDAACALAHVAWNATILNELHPEKDYVKAAKDQGGNIPELNALIDMMVERKKKFFSSDKRIIGAYDYKAGPDEKASLWTQIHEDSVMQ